MDELLARIAKSALHDTASRQNDDTSECNPKTRQLLLKQLVDSPAFAEHLIQWFWGPAGAGKTSVMRSFAKRLEEKSDFLAGFFFWRSDGWRNHLGAFFPTISVQLAENDPSTHPFIQKAMQEDKRLLDKSYATQMEKLVIRPLLAAHYDYPDRPHPRFIVIDGLDECDSAGQREFLENLLPTLTSRLAQLHITIFVSSRPESAIDDGFSHPRLNRLTNRICLEPSKEDIRQFLDDEFEEVNRCHPGLKAEDGGKWPRDGDLGILEDKSSGYFILVKTAMRYIKPDNRRGRPPNQRLRDILEGLKVDALRPLDALYLVILRQNAPEDLEELVEWKTAVGLACLPVKDFKDWTGVFGEDAFNVLYGKSRLEVDQVVRDLGSLFYADNDTGQPRYYHASFPDCIFNDKRSAEFASDSQLLHERISCAIIGSLNSVHISEVDGKMPYRAIESKIVHYRRLLQHDLHQKLEFSPALVVGGRLESTLSNVHFGQLISHSHKGWPTFALAAVMWRGLFYLFERPGSACLSHCRGSTTLKLSAFLHQFLEVLQFDESTDYLHLLDLLGRFYFGDFFRSSFQHFFSGGSPAITTALGYTCAAYTGGGGEKDLFQHGMEEVDGTVVSAIQETTDDLGISMFKIFSHFFNDGLVHRCPSLFLREIPPEGTWLVRAEYPTAMPRATYQGFLILFSTPHQGMLTRMWDFCNSSPINNPLDAAFEECRPRYSGFTIFAEEMRCAILQYFSLCRQAGMRPEGLSTALEATWLSMCDRCPVPPDSITVLNSFPEPHPNSPAAQALAENPSLYVYMPTLGKMKPTAAPITNPSRVGTVTSSKEPLPSTDTKALPRCESDGEAKAIEMHPSSVPLGDLSLLAEVITDESAAPTDVGDLKTTSDLVEHMTTSNGNFAAVEVGPRDRGLITVFLEQVPGWFVPFLLGFTIASILHRIGI